MHKSTALQRAKFGAWPQNHNDKPLSGMDLEGQSLGLPERKDGHFHMKSTVKSLLCLLGIGILSTACTKDGSVAPAKAGRSAEQGGGAGKKAAKKPETPEEMSYRLRPRLLQSPDGSGDLLIPPDAPLLALDKRLGIGVVLVLRHPGGDELPSKDQLAKILALGKSLPEVLARNLRQLMNNKPRPVLQQTGTVESGPTSAQLIVDRPGIEALVLLPEFWDLLETTHLQRKLALAMPGRNTVWFYPADEKQLLDSLSPLHFEMYRSSGDPLCASYILRDGDRLVPGKRFAPAEKNKEKKK